MHGTFLQKNFSLFTKYLLLFKSTLSPAPICVHWFKSTVCPLPPSPTFPVIDSMCDMKTNWVVQWRLSPLQISWQISWHLMVDKKLYESPILNSSWTPTSMSFNFENNSFTELWKEQIMSIQLKCVSFTLKMYIFNNHRLK
jgi:hypothetical protein